MAISKVMVDTNICLDAALARNPFAANAMEIVERSQFGDFKGMIAAHSFDTIFYIINNKAGRKKAYKVLQQLRRAFDVASVTQAVIDRALESKWPDFEDNVHYHAAKLSACDAIITRNGDDFKKSSLPVYSPIEFLNLLN